MSSVTGPRPRPAPGSTPSTQQTQQTPPTPPTTGTQGTTAPAAPPPPEAPANTATTQSAGDAQARARNDVAAAQRQAQVGTTPAAAHAGATPSLEEARTGHGLIQRGAQGDSVRDVQQRLNQNGADPPLAEDGIFGRDTETAVKRFQQENNLTVDGKIGENTAGALSVPTAQSLATDPAVQNLNQGTRQDLLHRMEGASPEARTNLANLATNPGFGQLNPTHQRQMLDAQQAAPNDAQLNQDLRGLADNPAFRNLNDATASEVLRHSGTADPATRQNVSSLATSSGFGQLSPAHQRQMLDAQAQAPRDPQLTQDLTGLAGSPGFRNLNDSVKTNALEEISRHPTDPAARQTLSNLAQSPGFGALSDADKNRMLNYAGGTNPLSTHVRPQLDTLLRSPAYSGADAAGQSQQLRTFMQNNQVPPGLVSSLPAANLPQRPHTVHGPTAVTNHAFASGAANANRYEVEIDGRRVPVFMPQNPNSHQHTIDQVAQSLASLPAANRAAVNQVNVNPGTNPADPHWAQVYHTPNFRSYMTAGSAGTVDIYPSSGNPPGQTPMALSMTHETGHVVSNRAWGDSANDPRWNTWRSATQHDGVSPSTYATNSPQEDFAETMVLYQRVRGTPQEAEVRAMMPERFRVLDGMGI